MEADFGEIIRHPVVQTDRRQVFRHCRAIPRSMALSGRRKPELSSRPIARRPARACTSLVCCPRTAHPSAYVERHSYGLWKILRPSATLKTGISFQVAAGVQDQAAGLEIVPDAELRLGPPHAGIFGAATRRQPRHEHCQTGKPGPAEKNRSGQRFAWAMSLSRSECRSIAGNLTLIDLGGKIT